ncbi:hypothetical protein PIB30_098228, partial [Stylosanthes scabra]|nr:hypothetical protein [Stylosanthes scabra]
MESQGVSSGSRRTAGSGDGRSDRSSSSTQGVFIAKVGDDKDGVVPKCTVGCLPYSTYPRLQATRIDCFSGAHSS